MRRPDDLTAGADGETTGRKDILFGDDGVDLTLIRWMLSLTPAERLQVLQGFARSLLELRHEESDT